MIDTLDPNDKRKRNSKKNMSDIPNINDYRDKLKKATTPLSYTLKVNEFAMRGLNKYKNILSAPECDCGCGGKGKPIFDNKDDLYNFCGTVLENNGCENSAIFLIHKDGKQEIVYGHVEYDEVSKENLYISTLLSGKKDTPADFFAKFDADVGLHCYGLMIEKDGNSWEICE